MTKTPKDYLLAGILVLAGAALNLLLYFLVAPAILLLIVGLSFIPLGIFLVARSRQLAAGDKTINPD